MYYLLYYLVHHVTEHKCIYIYMYSLCICLEIGDRFCLCKEHTTCCFSQSADRPVKIIHNHLAVPGD